MERWSSRVALVTGANSGIGEAVARALALQGMKLIAFDINTDGAQKLAEEMNGKKGEVHFMQGDVTKEVDVKRAVKWARDNLGGADVLVNSAGINPLILLTDFASEDLMRCINVNVLGLSLMTREVLKDMLDRGVNDGHIVHIGSIHGHGMNCRQGTCGYAATKHAVRVFTEGLKRELRDLGTSIRVTEVSPGMTRTNINVAGGRMSAEQAQRRYETQPCLEPGDVADAIVYALSTPAHVQVHNILIHPLK